MPARAAPPRRLPPSFGPDALAPSALARSELALTALALTALAGCATPPEPPPAPEPERWTISRTVSTDAGMITLFDPDALAHHRVDPPDWYRHDFGFMADLAAGRFVAVLTGSDGTFDVRITDAPLSAREAAAAGPRATLRLRVTDERLLLAGGDAWPSTERPGPASPFDERWLRIDNGDYEVTITRIDDVDDTLHDVIFRLEPVESIGSVAHAPGIPQLVVGRPPAVAGVAARGQKFVERCSDVPREGLWSPPVGNRPPLPGEWGEIEVVEAIHDRGLRLQEAALDAALPLVVAKRPLIGELGTFVRPARWLAPVRAANGWHDVRAVSGRASCLVRITSVDDAGGRTRLGLEPVPTALDRLPTALRAELVERFDTFVRVTSDPAWRYKSAWIRRAPDDRSLVFGIMRQLRLDDAERESLLLDSNESRARRLLERMSRIES